MPIKFSEETQQILKKAKVETQLLKHPFIGSEHVLLSILNNKNNISIKLNSYGINYNNFKKMLINTIGYGKEINNYFIYTPLLKRVLEGAIIDAKELNSKEVTINNIFISILDEGEGVGIRILNKLGIDIDKLYDDMTNSPNIKRVSKKLTINECSDDLTKKARNNLLDPLIGREKEVNSLIEILSRRNKNNPLLIGEAGVGKTAIVEELSRRIVTGNVPDKLKNNRVFSLSMASLVSGTKYRGEFEERINKIIKELEGNPELIIFIDEIHTIVGAGGAEGAIDASNILKPALARGNIKVIGATTINEYKNTICKDKALNRRFQTIMIKENSIKETKEILTRLKPIYEEYHHVNISNSIIDYIVDIANKYIYDKKNPDKSIDILDTVCTKVSLKKNNNIIKINKLREHLNEVKKTKNDLIVHHHFNDATKYRDEEQKLETIINKMNLSMQNKRKRTITIKDIQEVMEEKTNIPILENNKTKKILSLKKYLQSKIIGQNNVIDDLVNISKKINLGLKSDLPYSILFVGKSGVGKTEMVKEYSKYMDIPLIKLDMADYKENHTISKIIGSPPGYVGYNEYGSVLEKIRNNPYSIVLLDEIEKANIDIINLFLGILDTGVINDSHGEEVSFKNTIIIMTSNIGSNNETIGFNNKKSDIEIKNVLSTSFVNRINKICYFNDLTDEIIKKIVKNKIKTVIDKYKLFNIKITVSNNIINNLIEKSDYNNYGARHINKVIEDKIDNLVIDSIFKKDKKIVINNL